MRIKNTVRNLIWNFISQLTLILTGLALKRILLHTIGAEKVGLNYAINDIIGVLAIAELGVTSIIAYQLYEPLERDDKKQIIKIMQFCRKAYYRIGVFIMAAGFLILPALSLFINRTAISKEYMYLLFVLFLLRNTEKYFFSYKTILPFADQKNYVVLIVGIVSNIVHTIGSIYILLYTKNYLYVLFFEFVKNVVSNLILILIVNRWYPYIRTGVRIPLEKEESRIIRRSIRNTFIGKVSKTIMLTKDNIIMTFFLGLDITGLFSNYTLVLYSVRNVMIQLVLSAQASIGNLLVSKDRGAIVSVNEKMTFLSFFVISILGCILMKLTTPFVILFFGKEYILSEWIVLLCVLAMFFDVLQNPMVQLSEAGGLFLELKRVNYSSCIINVVLSLIGVKFIGLSGVLLGTLIAKIYEFIMYSRVNYQYIILESSRRYFLKTAGYMVVFLFELFIVQIISGYIGSVNPLLEFLMYGVVAGTLPLCLNILIYHSSEEYRYMKGLFLSLAHKIPSKKGR